MKLPLKPKPEWFENRNQS